MNGELHDDVRQTGPSLGELVVALRATWLPLLVFVLVASASGYIVGTTGEPRYEATAAVSVADPRSQIGVFGDQVPGGAIAREEAQLLAGSTSVRLRVAERLELPADAVDEVRATTSEDRDDPFIELTARADTPARAIDQANAFAAATVEERRHRLRGELERMVHSLRREAESRRQEIAEIDAERALLDAPDPVLDDRRSAASAALNRVRERSSELEIEAGIADGGLSVADEATEAPEVARPAPWHLAVLGALVAGVLGVAIVYLRLSYEAARARAMASHVRVIDLDRTSDRRASETS